MAVACMVSSVAGVRDEVYVATTPLRGTKGPGQFFLSAAFSLGAWDLQHCMLIVKPSSSVSQAIVFDFQPEDPENLYVALAALSGQSVPGAILERKISKLPRNKCWLVGSSMVDDALEEARKFNHSWETDLRIGRHDCRDYVNGPPPLYPYDADGIIFQDHHHLYHFATTEKNTYVRQVDGYDEELQYNLQVAVIFCLIILHGLRTVRLLMLWGCF